MRPFGFSIAGKNVSIIHFFLRYRAAIVAAVILMTSEQAPSGHFIENIPPKIFESIELLDIMVT